MARKKKRSAKQLANDRRLGRMAKARAKAKRGGRRKVARKNPHKKVIRKKVAKRLALKKSHLWFVFRCYGKSVMFLTIGKQPWRTAKGDGVFFRTKSAAGSAARIMTGKRGLSKYKIGIASAETTAAQIAAQCTRGK